MQSFSSYFTCFPRFFPVFHSSKNKQKISPCDPRVNEIRDRTLLPVEERLETKMKNHVPIDDTKPVIGRGNSQSFTTHLTPINRRCDPFLNHTPFELVEKDSSALVIQGDIDPETGDGSGSIRRFMGTVDEIFEEGAFQNLKLHGPGKRIKIGYEAQIKTEIRYPTEEGVFGNGVLKTGKQTSVDGTSIEGNFDVDPEDGFLTLRQGKITYPNGICEDGDFEDTILRKGVITYPSKQSLEKGAFNERKQLINGIKYQKGEKKYEEGTFIVCKMERGKIVPYLNEKKMSYLSLFKDGDLYQGIKIQNGFVFIIEAGIIRQSYEITDQESQKLAFCETLLKSVVQS